MQAGFFREILFLRPVRMRAEDYRKDIIQPGDKWTKLRPAD